MNFNRRILLKSSLAAGMVSSAIGLGLLTPRTVMAAWNKSAFTAKSMDTAMENALGSSNSTASDAIKIETPDIAENGAVVPVSVKTSMTGVDSIALFADNNTAPLTVIFRPGERTRPGISVRIKMGKSGNVIAIVKSKDGKLHSAQKPVTVKAGGC